MSAVNPWEAAGRARKVRALTETIDLFAPAIWSTKPDAAELYLALTRMDRRWWLEIAVHSNVNEPSAATIEDVLAVYQKRQTSGTARAMVAIVAVGQ